MCCCGCFLCATLSYLAASHPILCIVFSFTNLIGPYYYCFPLTLLLPGQVWMNNSSSLFLIIAPEGSNIKKLVHMNWAKLKRWPIKWCNFNWIPGTAPPAPLNHYYSNWSISIWIQIEPNLKKFYSMFFSMFIKYNLYLHYKTLINIMLDAGILLSFFSFFEENEE